MCSFCTRLIDSMPPATATFTPSRITERAATAIACRPEAHCRSIVVPATVTGNPARIAPLRATFITVVPCCMAQPMTTSSTSPGADFRAPDRLPDHMPGHCRTFGVVQCAAIGLADRRAGGRHNYGLGHVTIPPVLHQVMRRLPRDRRQLLSLPESKMPVRTHPRRSAGCGRPGRHIGY